MTQETTMYIYVILTISYRICETSSNPQSRLSKPPWLRGPLRVVALWQRGRLAAPLKPASVRGDTPENP